MDNHAPIKDRLVVQIYGFQSTSPDRHYRHCVEDALRFGRAWSVSSKIGPPVVDADMARWQIDTSGRHWVTRTTYCILRLDDIVAARCRGLPLVRVLYGYVGLADFIFDVAILYYAKYAWKYALLTICPFAILLAATATSLLVVHVVGTSFGTLSGLVMGVMTFAAIFAPFFRYAFLLPMLEDWTFASVLVRRVEPALDRRLSRASERIARELERHPYDEILLIGHSLGAVFGFHLIERLRREPPFGGARMTFLTIGSSLLKIGLHSAARNIRAAVEETTSCDRITWIDFQSRIDVLNFPGVDPATALGIAPVRAPIVRAALFSQMLDPAAFKRLYVNLYRCHNQFVRAGTRRSSYDYWMFACGPFPLIDLVKVKGGATAKLSSDGALT